MLKAPSTKVFSTPPTCRAPKELQAQPLCSMGCGAEDARWYQLALTKAARFYIYHLHLQVPAPSWERRALPAAARGLEPPPHAQQAG